MRDCVLITRKLQVTGYLLLLAAVLAGDWNLLLLLLIVALVTERRQLEVRT